MLVTLFLGAYIGGTLWTIFGAIGHHCGLQAWATNESTFYRKCTSHRKQQVSTLTDDCLSDAMHKIHRSTNSYAISLFRPERRLIAESWPCRHASSSLPISKTKETFLHITQPCLFQSLLNAKRSPTTSAAVHSPLAIHWHHARTCMEPDCKSQLHASTHISSESTFHLHECSCDISRKRRSRDS
jgi:hypothetical protein